MKKEELLLGSLIVTNLIALCIAGYEAHRLKATARKLNIATDNLYETTGVDISKDLIDKTVKKLVKDEAEYQVEKAVSKASKDVIAQYESEIKNVVEDEFKRQRADVAKEMKRQIDNIDIRDIKRDVIREAKDECARKLKKDLDEISDKYTDQLESMTSIYSTIASKIESIGE